MFKGLITLLFFCYLWGCSSTTNKGTNDGKQNSISAGELQAASAKLGSKNLYTVVQFLRPLFIRPRTRGGEEIFNAPIVYFNGQRWGDVSALQNLTTADAAEVNYISPKEATFRFGSNHAGGAILVRENP